MLFKFLWSGCHRQQEDPDLHNPFSPSAIPGHRHLFQKCQITPLQANLIILTSFFLLWIPWKAKCICNTIWKIPEEERDLNTFVNEGSLEMASTTLERRHSWHASALKRSRGKVMEGVNNSRRQTQANLKGPPLHSKITFLTVSRHEVPALHAETCHLATDSPFLLIWTPTPSLCHLSAPKLLLICIFALMYTFHEVEYLQTFPVSATWTFLLYSDEGF